METRAAKRRKQYLLENNGSDRIRARSLDDFPEDIITHILTFLPTMDAVQTSFLSRKWRRRKLWRSLPFLEFDATNYPVDSLASCTRIIEFIDQTLKNRSDIPIQKFCFSLDSFVCDNGEELDICERIESKLDDWISYSISHKATELNIDLPDECMYDFNFNLLKNSCVRDLRFCEGIVFHGLPSLNLDSIRSVYLDEITLTDDMVVDLISWCNNLESLVIGYCCGLKKLRICSSTLKKFSLKGSGGSSLKICCPNLCSLSISDFNMNDPCIKDSASLVAPSLVEAVVHFDVSYRNGSHVLKSWSKVIRLFTHIKRLTTQNYWFEVLCENDASLDGCVFENLNHLELETGCGHCDLHGMAALLKNCPNITTLTLKILLPLTEDNGLVSRKRRKLVDKPLEFHIPNLKILNLKFAIDIEFYIPNMKILSLENLKDKKIEDLLRLMKKHGAALEKIVLWEPNGKRTFIPLEGSF